MKLGMIRHPNSAGFDYLAAKGLEFMEVCCNFDPESRSFIDTKDEIKAAIEKRFDVKVDSVNTLINRGKIKRVRMVAGKKPNWKKAYITLKAGQKIAEFEGV